MTNALSVEEIYDAVFDDACFDALPLRLAALFGARSSVFHWSSRTDALGELRHSGYFSDEQLAPLDNEFAGDDIWADAIGRLSHKASRCDDLIAARDYANSRIYNDWVRAMGDDTFHAFGLSLRTARIEAQFGFHRARGQGPFDDKAVAQLESLARPLERLTATRARLAASEARAATLEAALDINRDAVFILDDQGRPLHANAAAQRTMASDGGMAVTAGRLTARDRIGDRSLQTALRAAAAREAARGSSLALHADADDARPAIIDILPTMIAGQRRILAIMSAPDATEVRDRQLIELFDLSAAEAQVAILLADGLTANAIADRRQTSVATVRTQIKAIIIKMGVHRQSDVVAHIHALPRVIADMN